MFTLGLIVQLDMREAGAAAMFSQIAFMLWSMFYHSAIRAELPWLDKILVTPQVHRIHHSTEPAHHNRNFADLFPVLDIIFGTYEKPAKGEFAGTGIDDELFDAVQYHCRTGKTGCARLASEIDCCINNQNQP